MHGFIFAKTSKNDRKKTLHFSTKTSQSKNISEIHSEKYSIAHLVQENVYDNKLISDISKNNKGSTCLKGSSSLENID